MQNFLISTLIVAFASCFDSQAFAEDPAIFCYYSSFAQNRESHGKFLPEDIDPDLCTHIIFAFADIIQGKYLKPSSWNDLPNGKDKGLYARTLALKQKNPRLKVLLAVGGWRIGSEPFLPVVESDESRKTFARNVVRYLRKHKFDGLDVDWEFPGTRGSGSDDKYKFTALLGDLREAFERESRQTNRERLLLTMAAAGGSYFIGLAYEPEKIIRYVDYLLLMAYNYHGSWNEYTGHHSGLYPRSDESGGEREWNQAWTIDYWVNEAGAPRDKVIVGIATYGMSFTLADPSEHGLKAAAIGGGKGGKYTKEKGILAYYEICDKLNAGWNTVWLEEQRVPYAYLGDQWVGYDNTDSVAYKARNIKEKGLGGAFIWSVEMDDFGGLCGSGKYPLLTTIADILKAQDYRGSQYGSYDAASEYDTSRYEDSYDRDDHSSRRGYSSERERSRYRSQYDDNNDDRYEVRSASRGSSIYSHSDRDQDPDQDSYRESVHSDERRPGNENAFDIDAPQRAPEYYRRTHSEDRSSERDSRYDTRDIYDDQRGEDYGRGGRRDVARTSDDSRLRYDNFDDRIPEYDTALSQRTRVQASHRRRTTEYPAREGLNGNRRESTSSRAHSYDDAYGDRTRSSEVHEREQMDSGYASYKSQEDTPFSRGNQYSAADRSYENSHSTFRTIYDSETEKDNRYRSERRKASDKLVVPEDTLNSALFNEVYGMSTRDVRNPRTQASVVDYGRSSPQGTDLRNDDPYLPQPREPSYSQYGSDAGLSDAPSSSSGVTCQKAGMYPHPTSCRSYYICVRHGTRWYKFHLTCPPGLAYDPQNATCADVPSCRD